MLRPATFPQGIIFQKKFLTSDLLLLFSSVLLQVVLGLFFGHAYDMRIFLSTGYLVGTGQNPYIAQDLSSVFHNSSFQGITSIGYPPPWSLVLGVIYLFSYKVIPSFLLYNLAAKLPIIVANIFLAYLVVHILNHMGVNEKLSRRAWLFLLFNPFLLLTSTAWGQFDPVVALFSLLSLFLLSKGKLAGPAILLALAITLKPTAFPIILVSVVYLAGSSRPRLWQYIVVFTIAIIMFGVAPFILFGWDPTIILQHWNAQFSVGGGLTFMTFLEYFKWTYQLPERWWFLGWLWVPALVVATAALRPGITGFTDLLKKSIGMVMLFFLFKTWLSETNINLILPFVLILTSLGDLDPRALVVLWVVPLVFSFFNTSLAQLFFPSMSGLMDQFLKIAVDFSFARYALRTMTVAVWLVAGWWIIMLCFKRAPLPSGKISP